MKKKRRYDVISPDGFAIDRVETYPSIKKAKEAFEVWRKRFERQGYYSSNRGRIHLDDLYQHCKVVEI